MNAQIFLIVHRKEITILKLNFHIILKLLNSYIVVIIKYNITDIVSNTTEFVFF